MLQPISNLEKELKKLIIKLHLEYFGKGPEDLWIRVHKNIATFYCYKTIIPMEETMLRISNGKEEVILIREKILNHIRPQLYSEIEKVTGCKVLSFSAGLCVEANALHGTILFLQDIQKEPKKCK